eukprot:358031-Chlamydomonas_euryale.AAC.10
MSGGWGRGALPQKQLCCVCCPCCYVHALPPAAGPGSVTCTMYECMDVWMHGCTDVWMFGCMDAWMFGCMDAYMCGCMDGGGRSDWSGGLCGVQEGTATAGRVVTEGAGHKNSTREKLLQTCRVGAWVGG